jgi:hypothetical protein
MWHSEINKLRVINNLFEFNSRRLHHNCLPQLTELAAGYAGRAPDLGGL